VSLVLLALLTTSPELASVSSVMRDTMPPKTQVLSVKFANQDPMPSLKEQQNVVSVLLVMLTTYLVLRTVRHVLKDTNSPKLEQQHVRSAQKERTLTLLGVITACLAPGAHIRTNRGETLVFPALMGRRQKRRERLDLRSAIGNSVRSVTIGTVLLTTVTSALRELSPTLWSLPSVSLVLWATSIPSEDRESVCSVPPNTGPELQALFILLTASDRS